MYGVVQKQRIFLKDRVESDQSRRSEDVNACFREEECDLSKRGTEQMEKREG